MLFNVGFAFVTIFFLATGFLMFALPGKYLGLVNWYYSKRGNQKSSSTRKFLRWYYRASGFFCFSSVYFCFYSAPGSLSGRDG